MVKTASSALNLLINIGYFPVHVNLDLLKFNIRTDHSDEVISAAESLLSDSYDPDEVSLLYYEYSYTHGARCDAVLRFRLASFIL